VAYLFDTDALSELLRRQPAHAYLAWLGTIPRAEQSTSAVCIGELYKGAFRVPDTLRHVRNIEARVLPAVTVLPYDVAVARVYGEIEAALARAGQRLADADLQIAAIANVWPSATRRRISKCSATLNCLPQRPNCRIGPPPRDQHRPHTRRQCCVDHVRPPGIPLRDGWRVVVGRAWSA